MINISLSVDSSKLDNFLRETEAKYNKIIKDALTGASRLAITSLTKTTRHKDWTGFGRRSYYAEQSKNQVVIKNKANNNGFYYMPHIDRGGRAGKGGFIRPREFSKEAVEFVKANKNSLF